MTSRTKTKLVIVESPTKAKTIGKFLGADYVVESSYGHIRDLPKSALGVDTEHDFEPKYVIPRKAQPRVTALKKAAGKSSEVILATDEDREGEAIAWHLVQALGLNDNADNAQRIVFHEITEHAIGEALKHPRAIDMNLVNAQQARRVLDRIVGYKLSPFLWKKVVRGLSAGRVQSVALRLIADREAEIQNFKPQEYWTIAAELKGARGSFVAELAAADGTPFEKFGIPDGDRARHIANELKDATYEVTLLESKEVKKNPPAPFITSTLQQTAAKRLGMSSKKTMYLAQQLYENGHITYMRTDSVSLAPEAIRAAGEWIEQNLGATYALPGGRRFKNTSRLAQEAHEAIRPTNPQAAPDTLSLARDEHRLYDLIWRRLIASQMPPALTHAVRVEVGAGIKDKANAYLLAANGSTLQFDGFLKIWPVKMEEKELPPLKERESLSLMTVDPAQHFTEPPPRYNEASLIKTMEHYGIGRPSTYAPTISVILARNYVEKQQGRFIPTEIGTLVNKVLTENFPEIVDIEFTAKMEDELDQVAEGKEEWRKVMKDFYGPFSAHLAEKYETVLKKDVMPDETTDEKCEKCGKPMIIKFGRFGKFMACSGFPDCKNTKTLKEPPKSSGVKCPKCLASEERKNEPGELLERRVRKGRARGKLFWGCGKYPACDFAVWIDPTKTPPEFDPNAPAKPAQERAAYRKKTTRAKQKDVPANHAPVE
ncbi:MAG: hypothetical protein RL681_134 [Candidatus Parcubacteria bacterium]|jgi:DNA topoisomerase-1